jgi:hypothetical protein
VAHVEPLLEVREEPARHSEWNLSAGAVTVLDMAVILKGWSATETSGSAGAAVDIYDEASHTGVPVLPVRLAAGESAEAWYGPDGILFKNGVHLNVSAGAARGSVFYRRAHTG